MAGGVAEKVAAWSKSKALHQEYQMDMDDMDDMEIANSLQRLLVKRQLKYLFSFTLLVLSSFFYHQEVLAQQQTEKTLDAIINGELALEGEQPWMVAILYKASYQVSSDHLRQRCAGTLIDPLWVVTAAHCVQDQTAASLELVVGQENLAQDDLDILRVSEIVVHPSYNPSLLDNDIALLKLEIPSENQTLRFSTWSGESGSIVTAFGWGITEQYDEECELESSEENLDLDDFFCEVIVFSKDNNPEFLMQVDSALFLQHECIDRLQLQYKDGGITDNILKAIDQINDTVICGWDVEEKSAVCQGDSGGPLIEYQDNQAVLVGITSRGTTAKCNQSPHVDFYTHVAMFQDFILDVFGRDQEKLFSSWCPQAMNITQSSELVSETKIRIYLQWEPIENADNYILRFGRYPELKGGMGAVTVPVNKTGIKVKLDVDERYFVAIQAENEFCTGPLSPILITEMGGV